MLCVRTIELLDTTNEVFKFPGALEAIAEVRDYLILSFLEPKGHRFDTASQLRQN